MKKSAWKFSAPYVLFLVLFVVLPLLVLCYYAFTNSSGQPTLSNFIGFFTNTRALSTLLYSIWIALVTTLVSLILAYPTAYVLARGHLRNGDVWLVVLVMPMWINFTLRVTALKEILSFIEGNLAFHPFLNSIIAMTYDFLPFMIMPIYTALTKLDPQLFEAASDLGATKLRTLLKIAIPLSIPGIVSGIMMVFLPAMTNYVVLDMVYNSTYIMGSLIGSYFNSYDWNNGAMISVVLLLLIFSVYSLSSKLVSDRTQKGGGR